MSSAPIGTTKPKLMSISEMLNEIEDLAPWLISENDKLFEVRLHFYKCYYDLEPLAFITENGHRFREYKAAHEKADDAFQTARSNLRAAEYDICEIQHRIERLTTKIHEKQRDPVWKC